jgi:dissimilatory sulfite reductase related protein
MASSLATDRYQCCTRLEIHAGRVITLDESGHMLKPSLWEERIAAKIAATEGIAALTDAHWSFINAVRSYLSDHERAPGESWFLAMYGPEMESLSRLFPGGYRSLLRIAGTPPVNGNNHGPRPL